jgi:hypothetical protein
MTDLLDGETEENPPKVSIEFVKVGVNMGDHAQDVHNVLECDPNMTIGELALKVLGKRPWHLRDYDSFILIRRVRPLNEEGQYF